VQAAEVAEADGISCEVIDLRTLLPWDRATVGARLALANRRWVVRARVSRARARVRLRINAVW
jgi:pyruvate/2-oxoglutarate/acetoin dehydrogenase E1 component